MPAGFPSTVCSLLTAFPSLKPLALETEVIPLLLTVWSWETYFLLYENIIVADKLRIKLLCIL